MGEALWASMIQGHAPRLKGPHLVNSTNEDDNKENSMPTASSGKRSWLSSHHHMHAEGLDRMMGLMESQKSVQEQLLEEHIQANENHCLAWEAHEHTMMALLMIVCEGLLSRVDCSLYSCSVFKFKPTFHSQLKLKLNKIK